MASAKCAALGELTGQRPEEEGQAVVTDYPASDRTRAAGVLEAIGLGSNQQAQPGQHARTDGSHPDAADGYKWRTFGGEEERQDEPQGVV